MPCTLPAPTARPRTLDPDAAADHVCRLYRLAWALCGSPQLAEDLTQETYARVLSRPRRLHGDSDFHYLARTLRNVLHDHWRARGRAPRLVEDDVLAFLPQRRADGDPEVAVLAGEVYGAIARLPGPMRDVVAAVDIAGMSYAEAGRELRIPMGTVMSRLHRARSRVADAVGDVALAA